jgi:hypothetical protein
MVYYVVTSPYLGSTHPTKGDDSRGGSRNFHALGSYARMGKDIGKFGAGVVATGQPNDATARYG